MAQAARLKIKYFGGPGEDLVDLAEGRRLLDFEGRIILVDGRRVQSYAELEAVIARRGREDEKYVEVIVLPTVMGG